jgi:hypothetical protein
VPERALHPHHPVTTLARLLIFALVAAGCGRSGAGAATGMGLGDGGLGAGGGGGRGAGGGVGDGGFADAPSWYVPPGGVGGAPGGAGSGGGPPLPPGCVNHTILGERLPIDLYLMVDSSASMLQKTADGISKWDAIRSALSSFFTQPQSAGIGVGLQFFPRVAAGSARECTSDAACGAHGPCFGIRTCSGLSYIEPCATDADCGGKSCVPFGYCAALKDFCTPVGAPCANGADTCAGIVEGYCLGRDSCAAGDYGAPAVPIAQLPGAAAPLEAALAAQRPDGYTPTSAALAGALDHARPLARASTGRKVAVVLATDGLPTSCQPRDIGAVAAIAGRAFAETPPLPTFVIGVFAPEEQGAAANLNLIAQSGGTTAARLVNANRNVAQSFLAALDEIRATAVACEIKMPTTSPQGAIDYDDVNVRFTSGGGQEITIPNVADAAACSPTQGGWYYDVDPTKGVPTRILTCDRTCALLRGDSKGRLDIVVGCKTIVIK